MSRKTKILLVEDDPNFGSILKSYLELTEYEVILKQDGKQGLSAFRNSSFDLCILDIMMPEMDGFTLAREIKKIDEKLPLIFLTAKTLKQDILEGFRIGADDYLTKPFDSEVLLCKISAILKRNMENSESETEQEEISIGRFTFNHRLRQLIFDKQVQILSPKETELLKMMVRAKDGILSRKDALGKIWGTDNYFTTRSMDVFIARLRKYLKPDPSIEIINIHGNGYRLVVTQ
ncbi:MAG: response regulator transcription factor [Bacteroidetes bacterium]|nr:response regulator transcription factor [Bacteroidota bacterium]